MKTTTSTSIYTDEVLIILSDNARQSEMNKKQRLKKTQQLNKKTKQQKPNRELHTSIVALNKVLELEYMKWTKAK